MPSSQSSRMSNGGGGGAMGLRIQTMQRAANDYRQGIQDNKAMSSIAAEHLAKHSELERFVLRMSTNGKENDDTNDDESMQWLTTHRKRLKTLAQETDQRAAKIETFLEALTHIQHNTTTNEEDDEDDEDGITNNNYYETRIALAMNQIEQHNTTDSSNHHQTIYSEICNKLGEPLPPPPNARRGGGRTRRSNGGGDGDDDDEDLEVLPPTQQGGHGNALKCPLSSKLFEHPMKNTECGHVYSKQPMLEQIQYCTRNRKPCKCPVYGCSNTNVTVAQLQEDKEMEYKVRRERKRITAAEQQQSQLAEDVDDEDEDEEDENTNTNTSPPSGLKEEVMEEEDE